MLKQSSTHHATTVEIQGAEWFTESVHLGWNLQQKGTIEAPTAAKAPVELAHLGQCNTWPSMAWFGMSDMLDVFPWQFCQKNPKDILGKTGQQENFFNMSSTFSKIFLCQDAGAWGGNTGNAGRDFLGWWFYRNHIESISTSWRHDISQIYLNICQS